MKVENMLIERLHKSSNLQECWEICLEEIKTLGFDQMIYARKRHVEAEYLTNHSDLILFTNYSEEMRKFFVEMRAYQSDDIIHKLLVEEGVFSWDVTRKRYLAGQLSKQAELAHLKTREMGSKVGYSCGFGPLRNHVSGFGISIANCEDQTIADKLWVQNGASIVNIMRLFDLAVGRFPISSDVEFTNKQLQIFQMIAEGKSAADVANLLEVHNRTVENQLAAIRKKLNAETTTQAIFMATVLGIL